MLCASEGIAGSRMAGHITLTGREKDTIVLSNGENIEPQPIEDACCASAYISQMIVVGNNRRRLGALVAPATDAFKELEEVKGVTSFKLFLYTVSATASAAWLNGVQYLLLT